MHSSSTLGSRPGLSAFISTSKIKALVLATAILPFHSINASKTQQYNAVINNNKLTVVATANPTTVFQQAHFLHGFGYDLVRGYAQNLNVRLEFKIVPDNATALKMVAQGQANFALTTADLPKIESQHLTAFPTSCGADSTLKHYGLNAGVNWVFKGADDPLAQTASAYVCNSKQNGQLEKLASFYNRNVVNPQAWDSIQRDLKKRLPIYQASFKKTAQKYDLDWHLLVAIGYQESYLKADSVSPTGVRGLMMLTDDTAKAMGVSNRNDPVQSIQGGAKYYDSLLSDFAYIPYPDRNWYALVAYNMGPGAVNEIQRKIKAQGKNPNNWVNLYSYLDRNQARNARYRQAIQYVTRIRSYVEHIKTTPKLVNI